jgi:hypothetical protein
MGIYERLGVPSPDECVGVAGLTISLIGVTIGVAALFFLEQTLPAFATIVGSLLVGWVSFLYCVVWGESS